MARDQQLGHGAGRGRLRGVKKSVGDAVYAPSDYNKCAAALPGIHRPESRVVGISSGVVDPRRARGGLDGIGTYTKALLAHVERPGLAVQRVDTTHVSGRGLAFPHRVDIRLAVPLPMTIALGAVAHARTPGCSSLEQRGRSLSLDRLHGSAAAANAGGGDGLRRHPPRPSAVGEPAIAWLQELAACAKRPQRRSRDRDFGVGKGRGGFELWNPRRTNPRDPARNRWRVV